MAVLDGDRRKLGKVLGEPVEVPQSGGAALNDGGEAAEGSRQRSLDGLRGCGGAADHLKGQDDEGRAGGEGGGEEARTRGRRVPERAAAEADVEEGGDRVDRNGPDDGDEDKGDVEPLRRLPVPVAAVEQVAADIDVEERGSR